MDDRHYGDEIQDLLDRRLEPGREEELRSHLDACQRCRLEYEAMIWVKSAAASARDAHLPASLEAAIRDALAREDRSRVPRRALLAAAAGVLLGLGGGAWLVLRSRSSLPAAVAHDYERFRSGELTLQTRVTSPEGVEAFFRNNGITFRTRVLNLAMMRFALMGGRVHELHGRLSALFVYRGDGARMLVCQMYPGRLEELPPPDVVHDHRGFRFQVYHQGSITAVFWQEGETVCVLAGDFGDWEVLALAFEKAML